MHPNDPKETEGYSNLFSLPKKNAYHVPEGFFEELELDIRKEYPQKKKGLYRKMGKWARISVAAAILSLVLFGGFKIFVHKQYMPLETDRSIYTVVDGDKDWE